MDLNNLSLKELKTLKKDIEQAIAGFKQRKEKEARDKIEALAKELGFTIKQLYPGAKKVKIAQSENTQPKFTNPDDPSQTYGGRGPKPKWFKDKLKGGVSAESMLTQT